MGLRKYCHVKLVQLFHECARYQKSRDKLTVKFGCLTHNGLIDKIICEHTFYYVVFKKVFTEYPSSLWECLTDVTMMMHLLFGIQKGV